MTEENNTKRVVMIVVENEGQFLPLLSGGYKLAVARNEKLLVLVMTKLDQRPDWLNIPDRYDKQRIEEHLISSYAPRYQIRDLINRRSPVLIAFFSDVKSTEERFLTSEALEPLLYQVRCPLAIVRAPAGVEQTWERTKVLLPFRNDNNSRFALDVSLEINPNAQLTVASVVPEPADDADRQAQEQEFLAALAPWKNDERVTPRLLRGEDTAELWLGEAAGHDSILFGVGRGNVFIRALFGDSQATIMDEETHALLSRTDKPVVMARQYQGWFAATLSSLLSASGRFTPTMSREDRVDAYRQIRRAARPTQDFFITMGLSAGVAALGLILNSPAVIIGAMLIAPLMSSIIGMGLAIVQGDLRFLLSSTAATLRGIAIAVAVGWLIGIFYLDIHGTEEMLSRTGPTLLDLLVAVLSGTAAAYALCRKDMSASLPGVAIAVALVPPVATLGLFIGMAEPALAYGALLLFLTNMVAIVISSGIVFSLLGFKPIKIQGKHDKRIRVFLRSFLVTGLLVLLVSVHLTILTVEEIVESNIENKVEIVLTRYFDERDELSLVDWSIDEDDKIRPIITVHVGAEHIISRGEIADLADEIAITLEANTEVTFIQTPACTVLCKARMAEYGEEQDAEQRSVEENDR
jgi:uncharacterized hydrophobic protein (TIGR00271 family)